MNENSTSPAPLVLSSPSLPKHPTSGYKVFLSDPSLSQHFADSSLYTIVPSLEGDPHIDIAVVPATTTDSRTLAPAASWPYLYALASGARVFDTTWPSDPLRDSKAASFGRYSSEGSSGIVHGHEGCESLGAPHRMFKKGQKGRKKRGDGEAGTSCFENYSVFLAGKWDGALTREMAEILLKLGRSRRCDRARSHVSVS